MVTLLVIGSQIILSFIIFPSEAKTIFSRKLLIPGSSYKLNQTCDSIISFHLKRWYNKYKNGILEQEYDKILIKKNETRDLLRQGIIEEINFNHIMANSTPNKDDWIFFNRKFEYDAIIDFTDSAWHGHSFFAYDLARNIHPEVIVELGTHKGQFFFLLLPSGKGWSPQHPTILLSIHGRVTNMRDTTMNPYGTMSTKSRRPSTIHCP